MTQAKTLEQRRKLGCPAVQLNELKRPVNIESFDVDDTYLFLPEFPHNSVNRNKSGRLAVHNILLDAFRARELYFNGKIFRPDAAFLQRLVNDIKRTGPLLPQNQWNSR